MIICIVCIACMYTAVHTDTHTYIYIQYTNTAAYMYDVYAHIPHIYIYTYTQDHFFIIYIYTYKIIYTLYNYIIYTIYIYTTYYSISISCQGIYWQSPGEAQRSTSKSLVRGRGAKGEKTQGDNRGLWEFHWVSMGKVSRSGDVIGISLDFNGFYGN